MTNVIFIGLVSFFTDFSTEMVYPLIPLFLANVFGATPILIGIIEGIAESIASLLKVFSGYLTDRYQKKKLLAISGYATSFVYKLALVLSTSWGGVLFARAMDRLGKGIRTAPRDVLVSESATPDTLGKSFGLHKALDMAGSASGILAAFFLVSMSKGSYDYKKIFLYSCIPSVLSLSMFLFIKENKMHHEKKNGINLLEGLKKADSNLKLYFFVTFVFTLGNSSNTFLLLRAQNVGYKPAEVILLYFIYNAVSSILSFPLGKLSDRIGRKKILVAGYGTFAVVYAGFAFAPNKTVILASFILYGLFTALTAGVERALIAEIAPKELKGTMLGLQSTIVGIALFPASLIAGLLWTNINATAPFAFGSFLSIIAAITLSLFLDVKKS